MTYLKLLLALCIYTASSTVLADDVAAQHAVPEFCGQNLAAPSGHSLRWDCAKIAPESMASLEATLRGQYSVSYAKDPEFKIYVSNQAKPFSAWIFNGNKAARYRAIFRDDIWQGVGVTTYCADCASACTAFEEFAASEIPRPLFFQLGPPPPEAPEIFH